MEELVHSLIQTETLLESDMLGTLVASYLFLLIILFVSFLNVYSVDQYEFLYNKQKCFDFKHNMFFIIMYSKEKHVVSKKTFILELIGYLLLILSIVVFVCSLKQEVTTAFILLGIVALIIYVFGWVTGGMYGKTKKHIIGWEIERNLEDKNEREKGYMPDELYELEEDVRKLRKEEKRR